MHLVNYHYEMRDDILRTQENVTVSIRSLPGVRPGKTVSIRGWEFKAPLEVPLTVKDGYWTFTLPRLTYSAAAVISFQ